MASSKSSRPRQRGSIGWLPSGSARVKVYAGVDQLTGKKMWLRETVPARENRKETEREATRVLTRLLNQVDERRHPRTEATVNELLDRWLEVLHVERKTRAGYVSKINKHLRPTLGRVSVGRVEVETVERLYAQLRRCRDHCQGQRFVVHRTTRDHVCDEHSGRRTCAKVVTGNPQASCKWCRRRCSPHRCEPLSPGSVRVLHAILSGAFSRAVRWGWITVNPMDHVEPPALPRPKPSPPSAAEATAILAEAWKDPDWGTLVWFTMTTGARRGDRGDGAGDVGLGECGCSTLNFWLTRPVSASRRGLVAGPG